MTEENFDRIADEYDDALPPHVVEHYLAKRVRYPGARVTSMTRNGSNVCMPADSCAPAFGPAVILLRCAPIFDCVSVISIMRLPTFSTCRRR